MSIFRVEKKRNKTEKIVNKACSLGNSISLDGELFNNIKGFDGLYWVYNNWEERLMFVVNWSKGNKMWLYYPDGTRERVVEKLEICK